MSRLTIGIGDPHFRDGISNRRADWLGNMFVEEQPDTIVCAGDFNDFPSLSSYDVGKKCFEGRRFKKDVAAGVDAARRIYAPIEKYNKSHRKPYRPRMVMILGNHDAGRISKAIDGDPKLDGTISIDDCQYEKYGWQCVPFLKPIRIDGITWQHYFTSGVMGRPVGGEMPALSLIKTQYTSCFQGHSHLLSVANRTRPDGTRIWAAHIGCYLDPNQRESYAGPANEMWSRGLVRMRNVRHGDFDSFEWIDIHAVKRAYG